MVGIMDGITTKLQSKKEEEWLEIKMDLAEL